MLRAIKYTIIIVSLYYNIILFLLQNNFKLNEQETIAYKIMYIIFYTIIMQLLWNN